MRGKVKWFNNKFGYGFIEYKEKDIFVHFSEIKIDGYKYLTENDIVEFDYDKENNKALNVKIIKKENQVSKYKQKPKSNWRG